MQNFCPEPHTFSKACVIVGSLHMFQVFYAKKNWVNEKFFREKFMSYHIITLLRALDYVMNFVWKTRRLRPRLTILLTEKAR